MEMILTDEKGNDLRAWNPDIDLDNGDTNDFEIVMDLDEWKSDITYDCRVYVPGTEYGGMIGDIESNTKAKKITVRGDTWRGMMAKKVIEPPQGQDYRTVSGKIYTILKELVEPEFSGIFKVPLPAEDREITYQFDRYCTLLEGLQKMLRTAGMRLQIRYLPGTPGESGYVEITAVPVTDYSEDLEYS